MNTDHQSLQMLLSHAERQRDDAQAAQIELEAARRAAASQAEQLVTYRREYEQRWAAEFSREGKIELVRCYQGFMERLTQAVEHQERIAVQAGQRVQHATALLRDHEVRAAALRKLLERRQAEAGLAGARLEQKQSDELAARVAWIRHAGSRTLGAS